MLTHWFLAAVHLLAFAMALAAVLARGNALRGLTNTEPSAVRRVLILDNIWGVSALVLLITGGMRAFGGYEKGTEYYLHQPLFHLKMTLLLFILLLEIMPMIRLIKWRIALARGSSLDLSKTRLFARISHIQALLVVLMVIAATGMARGIGLG
jgi:putative membrane protein